MTSMTVPAAAFFLSFNRRIGARATLAAVRRASARAASRLDRRHFPENDVVSFARVRLDIDRSRTTVRNEAPVSQNRDKLASQKNVSCVSRMQLQSADGSFCEGASAPTRSLTGRRQMTFAVGSNVEADSAAEAECS